MNDSMFIGIIIGLSLGAMFGTWAAYRNGATDGYRFARDPYHPGARKAGRYLFRTMGYFYPDVPDPDNDPAPQQGENE